MVLGSDCIVQEQLLQIMGKDKFVESVDKDMFLRLGEQLRDITKIKEKPLENGEVKFEARIYAFDKDKFKAKVKEIKSMISDKDVADKVAEMLLKDEYDYDIVDTSNSRE